LRGFGTLINDGESGLDILCPYNAAVVYKTSVAAEIRAFLHCFHMAFRE